MIQAPTRRFHCLVLGEEPLAAHCSELLLERGHSIIGLVTTSPLLSRWAVAHAVPVIAPADYPEVLATGSVELLFSITHPTRISPLNLARASLAAINYHDGPLPRYSGINASAWAIANGESHHAVVWHHMVSDIDAGPILERRRFELEARESSISLNMRNAALARESFRALLGRLERGDSRGTPQEPDAERTVYARHDRPPALCTVDWGLPAETLDRLIRACEFGNYPNRFGLVKIVQGDHAIGVRQSFPIDAGGPPGTLLSISADHLDFACGTGALRLGHFTTLTGMALTAPEAASALGLAPGDRVHDPRRAARAPLNRPLAEAEPYFVAALRDAVVPELPFELMAVPVPTEVEVPLPPTFLDRFSGDRVSACVALYALVWSCLLRQDVFDLAVVDPDARAALAAVNNLLSPSAPLQMTIWPGLGFAPLLAAVAVAWRRLSRAGGFLADLIARHPELIGQDRLKQMHLSPLAVVLGDAPLPPGAAIGLAIKAHGVQLLSDGRVQPAAVQQVALHLAHVASVVAEDSDRPVAGISLLDARQREIQIFAWNATERPFRETSRLQDDFERQADERPDDVALVCNGKSLSFREVERRANRIAHALAAMGARPGTTVGLMVERGFEMVLAMLGAAKSGAAYVPIDPSFPAERAGLILADAGCAVGLVSTSLQSRVEGACALLIVDGPEIAAAPDSRPVCAATARDVCYVIYTSGSTGAPKGVVLCHRAVVNTLEWFNRTFDIGPRDRLLFVTSPSFDLSVYDVFGALGAGASVEIATPDLLSDPAALSRRLCEPGITVWNSAPPALTRLVPFLQNQAGVSRSTLRLVTLSGDWIPTSLPAALQKIFAGVKVHSLGGATEAAIWSNHYPIGTIDPAWRSIPYGTPIQNAHYYVLDHHLRPLPVGMPGELYIGGVCLAEGYLNRAELTAERFLVDPFRPGQGIYKTGDLARYDDHGTLELLGRVDFQVKIRGFRVEVGEIEAAIRASGMVLEVVVVAAVTDASEQKSLVAYVVPDRRVTWQSAALRSLLSRRLPDFMIPAIVIPLEALPLSASGKVDRRALPDPRSFAASGHVAPPRTRLEHSLVQLWQELLHKKPVGIHDDFFALGGHSLLATLLVTRIANRLGVAMPLSQLVLAPTIAQMAEVIEARRAGKQSAPLYIQCMNLPGEGTPVYMTSGVGGHVFIFQEVAELLGGEHTVHGIRAVGADGECEPRDNLQEVAAIYVRELLAKPPVGPIAIGGYSLGAPVAFELAHQLLDRGVTVLGLIFVDGFAPGYPRKLPLLSRLGSHLAELRAASPPRRRVLLRNRTERLVSRLAEKVGVPIFVDKNIGFEHDEELVRAMDPSLKRQLTRLWMKMHAAGDAYRISRSLSLPLLLLKSRTPFVGTADEPTNGWSSGIDGPIDVVTIEGDHEAMIGAPAMRQIAGEIRRWLAVQQQRQTSPGPLRAHTRS